ncbi:hypothetical protein IJG72_08185 [bacterium]|nr:hypothetical protein [bacterium]
MNNGFIENGFIINLSNAKNSAEVIYELSSILDMQETKNKKICLRLESVDLTKSQMLSIKALIESNDSTLEFVDSVSEITKESARGLDIQLYECNEDVNVPQIEPTEQELENSVEKNKNESKLFANEAQSDIVFQELAHEEGLISNNEMRTYALMDDDEIPDMVLDENEKDVEKISTLYLNQTLRSGQTISYDGNIVVIGDANPGSEIIARGDIAIWGVLGGIAHAGSRGNEKAVIRALKLNAIQLRIANVYARRVNTENVPFVQKSASFTPEEARIEGKTIVINTTYESKERYNDR